jgi:hypothetical protein
MARNSLAGVGLAGVGLAGVGLAEAGLAGHLVACLPMAWPARAWARLVRERLRTRLCPAGRSGLASALPVRWSAAGTCVQPRAGIVRSLTFPHGQVTGTTVVAR